MSYQIKEHLRDKVFICVVDGETVNLQGKPYAHKGKATKEGPAVDKKIPAANQKHYNKLMKGKGNWDWLIEEKEVIKDN